MSPAIANRTFCFLHHHLRRFSSTCSAAADITQTPLQSSVESAIISRDYLQIPTLLRSQPDPDPDPDPDPNPNPFAFLSFYPPNLFAAIVSDLLRSFAALRPRSLPFPAYAALLAFTLPHPSSASSPFPIHLPAALAVLQSTLRSGLPPPTATRLSFPVHWLTLRRLIPVAGILLSIRPLGFCPPDLNTLNYLVSSLRNAGEIDEAVAVLRGMPAAGIEPDSAIYSEVIEAADGSLAEELLREMVAVKGIVPRKRAVVRAIGAMRAEGKARRAAELVRFLESGGCEMGFEEYEAAAEGCLESGEIVAAARVVAEMAERGFIPHIGVRTRVVEGLAAVGQAELSGDVRRRLSEIRS